MEREKAKVQKKGVEIVKRQVFQEEEKNETSESVVNSADLCDDSEDDDMKDDGNRCITGDEFGQDNEMWYRCTSCGLWYAVRYLCENCFIH